MTAIVGIPHPSGALFARTSDSDSIVFSRTGNEAANGVYVIGPDGSGEAKISNEAQPSQIRVFQNRGDLYEPTWSPDHNAIAYSGYGPDGFDHVYVVGPDGEVVGQTNTSQGFGDVGPSWAGSAQRVVMEHHADEFEWIRKARVNETTYGRVGNCAGFDPETSPGRARRCVGFDPEASPDGTTIAFRGINDSLFICGRDGSNRTRLTSGPVTEFDWSPDGTRIAYVTSADGDSEIFTVKPDGSGTRRLTDNTLDDVEPDWSPDSGSIVFASGADGTRDIFSIARNGSALVQLTKLPTDDFDPNWSPDGMQLAYVSDRDGNDEIYVMNSDGTEQTRVTTNSLKDAEPDW